MKAGDYSFDLDKNALAWPTVRKLEEAVRAFLDPVLAGAEGSWSPDAWTWAKR